MNRNKLKTYAPKARRDFIAAVTARATKFGITKDKIEPVQVQGNVALIAGQAHPKKVVDQRAKLESRIKTRGFEQVMEEAAYTWFNRFAAIRYMEVHGYLDHGYRVLSHPEGKPTPEIVEHAQHLDLPGLDKEKVIDLKLDGNKESELYRMLLTAQCNALNAAMPFLFERIDDETELLLPDNLLHSDSVIRQMVNEIEEADWQEIEIIGWLYQFYISEKKDQVIGSVVKSEDIPAATQLFTPNWIVKYMVQNTLGAKWLATYPQSGIMAKMEFYIEPAEQTDEVNAKLAAITPKELNPEEITFLDPACGSGHILVEAYDLFKEIYLERGYVLRDVPRLILEKNLFGLDIDDRAAQMAAFALLMKARADDRRVFERSITMNVMAIQDSKGLDAKEICRVLVPDERFELVPSYDLLPETLPQPTLAKRAGGTLGVAICDLIELFENAKTFGSLLVSQKLTNDISVKILDAVAAESNHDNNVEKSIRIDAASSIIAIALQEKLLSKKYDCVVANPPYIGSKGINPELKKFISNRFPACKADLYACFVERMGSLTKTNSKYAAVTMETWMFLSSFEDFRKILIGNGTITSLGHYPYDGKSPTVMGISFGISAFCMINAAIEGFKANYHCSRYFELNDNGVPRQFPTINERLSSISSDNFSSIPGSPIAYWASRRMFDIFSNGYPFLNEEFENRQGLSTTDSDRFVRFWFEQDFTKIGFGFSSADEARHSEYYWFPFNKGGDARKWYGNQSHIVRYENGGDILVELVRRKYPKISDPEFVIKNRQKYFRKFVTYIATTSAAFVLRYVPNGFVFSVGGPAILQRDASLYFVLGLLNSVVSREIMGFINPTMGFQVGDMEKIPISFESKNISSDIEVIVSELVDIGRIDWNSSEISWDFQHNEIAGRREFGGIKSSYLNWLSVASKRRLRMKQLEEDNNRLFLSAYGLTAELSPDVDDKKITLASPSEANDIRCLISYAIGCMMGRYTLDEPGLIYANSGNVGFDPSRYTTFPADDDGIVPIMQTDWFDDDATNRVVEFIKVAWSPETLTENLKFVADSLGARSGETPIDTIRRYLSSDFFKDHLKTYKKRPIYWLFSSGKEKAFEALVYLHRYNEGTLSRMRMEYVTPLQGRIASRIDQLGRDIDAAASTAAQNKLRKEQEKLKKQQAELIKYDEELRHYADMRIKLDLDDGVKVNYGKFGNLLAEVKAITGGSDE